ncbi:MAG: hypothetical protein AAFO72_02515, partial [Pseudomonadota bacterium]
MPFDLALADLFRPYLLRGEATTWHAALSVIYVESYETAVGPGGTVIRGIARFSGNIDPPSYDPVTGTLQAGAGNIEGHPRNQPDRSEPWLDITDTKVEFTMSVPRAGSPTVANGVGGIPGSDAGFQPVRDVLDALDAPPIDVPVSDYPNTAFVLDLVLSGIEIRPPFLEPAEMRPDGLLIPHSSRQDVVFHLPKIKVRLTQGLGAGAPLNVCLLSLGAQGLDDPGALSAAELIRMEPAHAFIGSGRIVGFGFRSAYLDLSTGYTPPEVLSQFGFDESWTGLYLPELRLFFAPNGAEDFAVNAGVENLLIGLDGSSGLTGDFDVAVINQGAGDLVLGANFWENPTRAIGITRTSPGQAIASIPETTRMAVDVRGGRAPYAVTVDQGTGPQAGLVHDVTVPASGSQTITISVTDASAPQKQAQLVITANRKEGPSTVDGARQPAAIETTGISRGPQSVPAPEMRILSDNRETGEVRVGLEMLVPDPTTEWTVDGNVTTGPYVDVTVLPDGNEGIFATIPTTPVTKLTAYYQFDRPPKVGTETFALTDGNIRDKVALTASKTSAWSTGAENFDKAYDHIINQINPRDVTITGDASFDGNASAGKATYNFLLSQRRATGLRAFLNHKFSPAFTGDNKPETADFASWQMNWLSNTNPRNIHWVAEITGFSVSPPALEVTGTVTRPATPQIQTPEVPD